MVKGTVRDILKRLEALEPRFAPPTVAVDDAAVLALLMADMDRLHDKLHASGTMPPTSEQLAEFQREFDAQFPSGAGCWSRRRER
jgi:hypothetical protein